jgi:hypothetical protein
VPASPRDNEGEDFSRLEVNPFHEDGASNVLVLRRNGADTIEAPRPHSWISNNLLEMEAHPYGAPTIGGLLYPGLRTLLSGETESMKTWFALMLAKEEMQAGHPVAWADLDAMGPGEILLRLRSLGVADDLIARRFCYKEPTERLAGGRLLDVCEEIEERGVRMFVLDAFNAVLRLHGLDPNKTPDVEAFWFEIADAIGRAGAAPVLLDHVPKNPDARGKYAYGSERKASGASVHIGFDLLEALTRGGRGRSILKTNKDRPAHLPRPRIGTLVLESDGYAIAYRIEPDHSHSGDKFRPTHLMEKVSAWLELQGEPVSRRTVERAISGKGEAVRAALNVLAEEGYTRELPGPKNARLVESLRPYREAEDDREAARVQCVPSASQVRPDGGSETSESCASVRPSLKGDADAHDGLTASPQCVPERDDVPF